MRKPRLLASLLCAVLMLGVLTVPAYAGGGDESEDGLGEYIPWEGLEPAEPLPTEPNPFTPDGTGTVVDNATNQDGKEFFTITTAEEAVFYLVIDRQRETENVYFLNAVTVADLMALAESSGELAAPEPPPEPEREPTTTPEPEPVPEKKGRAAPAGLGRGGHRRRGGTSRFPAPSSRKRRSRRRTTAAIPMTARRTMTARPPGMKMTGSQRNEPGTDPRGKGGHPRPGGEVVRQL